jgi:hypothetical protein
MISSVRTGYGWMLIRMPTSALVHLQTISLPHMPFPVIYMSCGFIVWVIAALTRRGKRA